MARPLGAAAFEITALVTFRVPWLLARSERLARREIENLGETRIERGLREIEIVAVEVTRSEKESR